MTTEISKQKHPVPPDRHAQFIEDILARYRAAERRRAIWRIVGACAIYAAFIAIILSIAYYLFQ